MIGSRRSIRRGPTGASCSMTCRRWSRRRRADAGMNGPISNGFARTNGRVAIWLARVAACALAVIAAVTFGDVIGRYFFHAPFAFTVELTQMAMGLVVYF